MPAFNQADLFNYITDSPEFISIADKLDKSRSNAKGNFVPGGKIIQDLFKGDNVINSRALDAVGGAGQYKLPQRLLAALVGSYAFGDETEPLSVGGGIAGYAAGAGIDEGIRRLRDRYLTEAISAIEQNKGLINIDRDYINSQIKAISGDLKGQNLAGALEKEVPLSFNLSATPGSSYRQPTQSGYGDMRGYYSGDLLDEDVLKNLRGDIAKELKSVQDMPGYSRRGHLDSLNKLLSDIDINRKELGNLGINAKSLRESGLDKLIKSHELAEMQTLAGLDGNRAPMQGGAYNRRGASDIGSLGLIANHASPAVPLRESNLQARVAPESAKELNSRFRAILGEDKFFRKVLGTELGDVILNEKYINENADDIAKILQNYIAKGAVPEKALLDKVRVNPILSSLGRAGRSIGKFEHGLVDAVKTLIGRRK